MKLRDSELKFRSVAESATDAIVLTDGDGNIIFWNRSAQRIFDYSAHEVLDQPLSNLMARRYHETYREAIQKLSNAAGPNATGKIMEVHGKKKNGEEFSMELSLGVWIHRKRNILQRDDTRYHRQKAGRTRTTAT